MPDDVETLQKMVRWLAEQMMSAEESSMTYLINDRQREKYTEGWIHEARRGVTDGF